MWRAWRWAVCPWSIPDEDWAAYRTGKNGLVPPLSEKHSGFECRAVVKGKFGTFGAGLVSGVVEGSGWETVGSGLAGGGATVGAVEVGLKEPGQNDFGFVRVVG